MSVSRTELHALVESWRELLIPEWRVVLMDEPHPESDPDEYYAESQSKDDYCEICIHFTDECLARPQEQVQVTIVHELLHALTRPWRQQIRSLIGTLGRDAQQALEAARTHEEEQLVDRLSRALVRVDSGAGYVAYGTSAHIAPASANAAAAGGGGPP